MYFFVATHTTSAMSLKRKESPTASSTTPVSKMSKSITPVITAPTESVQIEIDAKTMEEVKTIAMQKKAYTEMKEKIECERAQRAKEFLEGDYKDYLFEATGGCKRTWERVVFSGHIPISIIDPTKEVDLSTLIPAVRFRHYNHTQAAVVIIPSDEGTPVIKLIDIKTGKTFDTHNEWHKTVYTRFLETGGPRAAKTSPSRNWFGPNYIFYKPLADVEQWEPMATLTNSDIHVTKKTITPVITAPTESVQIEIDAKTMEEVKTIAMQKKAYTEMKEKIECERAQRAKEFLEGDYKDYLFEATGGCKRTWERVVFSGHIPISIIVPTKEVDLSTLIPAVRLRHYNHTQAAVVIIPSDKGTPVIKLIDIKTAETFDKHSEWHKTVYTRYLETGGPRAAKEPPSRTAFGHNYIFYKPLADVEQWESMATLTDSDIHVVYSATKKKPSPPKPRDMPRLEKLKLILQTSLKNASVIEDMISEMTSSDS